MIVYMYLIDLVKKAVIICTLYTVRKSNDRSKKDDSISDLVTRILEERKEKDVGFMYAWALYSSDLALSYASGHLDVTGFGSTELTVPHIAPLVMYTWPISGRQRFWLISNSRRGSIVGIPKSEHYCRDPKSGICHPRARGSGLRSPKLTISGPRDIEERRWT
jgi:hypothetical protein